MSEQPSFERFDYLLRANKHIERKLIFDTLLRAGALMPLAHHHYLGFGSMWFGDFRFAHKLLGINKLLSMELKPHSDRANYNKPYGCIEVVGGTSSDILEEFEDHRWLHPYIAWFDFDGRLDASVVSDLATFVARCAANSVVIVTVNASRSAYRPRADTPRAREATSVSAVESFLGADSVDPAFHPRVLPSGAYEDIDSDVFCECLADSMLTFLQHKVVADGRATAAGAMQFVRLFNFAHKDGADMVTIGGVIASADTVNAWEGIRDGARLSDFCRLDLVPITIKEKLSLDSCMPHDPVDYVARAKAAGVMLADSQLEKYCRYFQHFPVFIETVI